jgi:hypothetical protein
METYALPSPLTGKIVEKKLQMIDETAQYLLTDKNLDTALEGKAYLPSFDTSNEGQFLRIVGGAIKWATIAKAEDLTF